jgi:hypothetical protein
MVIVAMAAGAHAQTWHTANQGTVAWDSVAKVADTDTIKYQVYTRSDLVSAGSPVGSEITDTQFVISFANEGRYYVGVKAIRYPQGETVGIQSATAWSSNAADCAADGPFGFAYFVPPGTPGGIKRVP